MFVARRLLKTRHVTDWRLTAKDQKGKMMKHTLHTVAAAALFVAAGSAFAGLSVSSAINTTGFTLLSDNSAEQWIDTNDNNVLDVGDRLRGILTIDTIENGGAATQIGGQSAYNELTGIYDIVVTTAVATGGFLGPIPLFNYTFTASGVLGANTAVVLYEDSANDYAREGCGTFAGCEATATGGNVWATYTDAFWVAANAANNPDIGATIPLTTPLGTFGVGLEYLVDNTGLDWGTVPCLNVLTLAVSQVDTCGQGGILASGRDLGQANTPYAIYDNIDFTAFAQQVPEPGTIGLVGLALAGLGFSARGRKNA
jgi:hypothetical protein